MTTALAERGYSVDAIDSVPAMIGLTRQLAIEKGVDNRIRASVGDAHKLAFKDQAYDLVIVLGVTSWLRDLKKALGEMARVLKPCGYIVLNADNRNRFINLFDPLSSPVLGSTRRVLKRGLERLGLRKPVQPLFYLYSFKEFKEYLGEVNILTLRCSYIGFGPFKFFGHRVFSDEIGVRIHRILQSWADRENSVLRTTGAQFVILAKKTNKI